MDVQITKWLHLSFLFSSRLGRGGVVWGWLYLINSLQKNTPKNRDSHPAVLLNFFKFCAPVVFFDSGYSLVVLGEVGRWYKRGSYITIWFPNIVFYYFYYHQINLLYCFIISKILVYTFNFFLWQILVYIFNKKNYKPLKFNRKMLSHKLCYIFDIIFRWKYFLERDISMIFCRHRHIIITHCMTLA